MSLSKVLPSALQPSFRTLFHNGLKSMHHAERITAGEMPSMVINASGPALIAALEKHMTETHAHILRLENIFTLCGMQQDEGTCEEMELMLRESNVVITSTVKGVPCDLAIIATAQKIDHYEMAAYENLRTLAELLDLREAADLLGETLDEEKHSDILLTEASGAILYAEINKYRA